MNSGLFENRAFSIAMMVTTGFFLLTTAWLLKRRYSADTTGNMGVGVAGVMGVGGMGAGPDDYRKIP